MPPFLPQCQPHRAETGSARCANATALKACTQVSTHLCQIYRDEDLAMHPFAKPAWLANFYTGEILSVCIGVNC